MNNTYSEMKDSGVSWIREIPSHWQTQKAKVYIKITNGSDPQTEGNIPVYGSGANSFKTCGEYKEGPAVLVGRKGSIDKPRYVNGHYWNVDTAFDVKTKNGFSLRLYYYLALCFDYQYYISQTTLPSMTQSNYRNMYIPIPSLPEQAAIAAYLDEKCGAIDEIIAEAKASVEEYKAWKSSVIFEAVTKGLNPDAEMKDSGVDWIGKVPKHWDVVPLKRFYDHSSGSAVRVGPFGSALAGSDITTDGVWVYNQRTVLDKNFKTNNTCVTPQKAEELSNFSVESGDILITTRGSIGKIAIIPSDAPRGILHPCIIRFRIDGKILNKELLQYIFNDTDMIKNQILYFSNSTTIDVLYSYTLKEIKLPKIPIDEQQEILTHINEKCATIDGIIAEKEALIADMEAYKKSLIFETVTGKRKVC